MNANTIVVFVMFVTVISGDESAHKYTQIVQPASRQLLPTQDGYQSDGIYPQQTGPYQMAYQTSNEGIYPPAEDINADAQVHQSSQSEQPLENPAYDPNMYQNFVPQDSVQQYVNSYGGPYAPGGHAVGYPLGYGAPGYGPGPGFAVQTGYEGFLVPQIPPPVPPPPGLFDILRNQLPYPRSVMSMVMRSGTYLLGSIGVILFGGMVTTAICTFTPFCTITFAALPFLGLREALSTKSIGETIKETVASEATKERVRRAADFLQDVYVTYNNDNTTTSVVTPERVRGLFEFVRKSLVTVNNQQHNSHKDPTVDAMTSSGGDNLIEAKN